MYLFKFQTSVVLTSILHSFQRHGEKCAPGKERFIWPALDTYWRMGWFILCHAFPLHRLKAKWTNKSNRSIHIVYLRLGKTNFTITAVFKKMMWSPTQTHPSCSSRFAQSKSLKRLFFRRSECSWFHQNKHRVIQCPWKTVSWLLKSLYLCLHSGRFLNTV